VISVYIVQVHGIQLLLLMFFYVSNKNVHIESSVNRGYNFFNFSWYNPREYAVPMRGGFSRCIGQGPGEPRKVVPYVDLFFFFTISRRIFTANFEYIMIDKKEMLMSSNSAHLRILQIFLCKHSCYITYFLHRYRKNTE
jgi:hypothetical protein